MRCRLAPGIVVASDMCSGNAASAEVVESFASLQGGGLVRLHVRTKPDNCKAMSLASWFNFSVEVDKEGWEGEWAAEATRVEITVFLGTSDHSRLYNKFLNRPVFKDTGASEWQRVDELAAGFVGTQFTITFKHAIANNTQFAFCFPYSYEHCTGWLDELQGLHESEGHHHDHDNNNDDDAPNPSDPAVYFHRELLARTVLGRRVELLTVSGVNGRANERYPELPDLFPDEDNVRASQFPNKKALVITARVHPGETPSSFMFSGFLSFLLSDDARAKLLREHCVFFCVPMLNPDGVADGCYRTDSNGVDLNRVYDRPSLTDHPSVYAVRQLVGSVHDTQGLFTYVDLHAHVNRTGFFAFGNHFNNAHDQAEAELVARLLSLTNPLFDMKQCKFFKAEDVEKKGDSKEGSGRVNVLRLTGCKRSFTLECHYCTGGVVLSQPSAIYDENCISDAKLSLKEGDGLSDRNFVNMGRSIAVALVDSLGVDNEWTNRLAASTFGSIGGLHTQIVEDIRVARRRTTRRFPRK